MKISCIMCVYNTKESDLKQAIESILNQTFSDFELVVVDDGSTQPHVKSTIQSYKDKRIKYYYKENQGKIAYARNFGLSKCRGEYIAVMDSDDISLPNRFEKQVCFLEAHPDISCVSGLLETFPEKQIWEYPQHPTLWHCLKDSPIPHAVAMWRRKDFEKFGLTYPTDYIIGEDFCLWCQALKCGLKFYNIQEILYKYRRENQGITTRISQKQINRDVLKIKEKTIEFLANENLNVQSFLRKLFLFPQHYQYRFLGIPILNVFIDKNVKKYYLFKIIPIVKIKTKGNTKRVLFFGISILKISNKIGG